MYLTYVTIVSQMLFGLLCGNHLMYSLEILMEQLEKSYMLEKKNYLKIITCPKNMNEKIMLNYNC